MANVIYLWNPKGDAIGHCSLQLDDGTYYSFWPKDEYGRDNLTGAKPSLVESVLSTFQRDVQAEGRPPDITIRLKKPLNKAFIKQWWSTNKNRKYGVVRGGSDCESMVRESLQESGYDEREVFDRLRTWRSSAERAALAGAGKKGRKLLT